MRYGRALTVAICLGLVLGGCSKEDPQSFSKVDYNKDGKVIFEELIVAFPDMTVEEFLAADADRNGTLDEKEYQRLREARASGKKLDASSAPPAAAAPAGQPKPADQPKPAEPAQPAAPAQAPTPAAPAPGAQVPAQAPAAPAPAAQAPQPAALEAEAVTVEVESAPAVPQAASGETYTVGKGDTLTRIAKKFGVSAKAIIDANNIKNPDRVDAGTILTIPGKAGTGAPAATPAPAADVPPGVADIVSGYFAKSSSGDINGLIDYYAESVNYYKKGKSGKDIVRQDKADYFARWPERRYEPGEVKVEKLPSGDLRVTVPSTFAVKKGEKGVRGKAIFTFLLRPAGDSFRIVGEQSQVTEKQ